MHHIHVHISFINQQGPWDQENFEQYLTEWIIACDQPFDEVEKPEFITMMNYAHQSGSPLKNLQCNVIKQHVMKMGEDTIEGVPEMFSVCYSLLNAFIQFYSINLESRSSKARLAYHLMHGHQETSMLSWP
jgi:hypothetical protein